MGLPKDTEKKKMVPKRELGKKRKPTKKLRNRGIKWTSENCDFFFRCQAKSVI